MQKRNFGKVRTLSFLEAQVVGSDPATVLSRLIRPSTRISLPRTLQRGTLVRPSRPQVFDTNFNADWACDQGWGKKPGFGGAPGKDAVGGGCFTCGGPHVSTLTPLPFRNPPKTNLVLVSLQLKRDCPQANGGGPGGAAPGLSGSNGLGAGTSRDAGWGSRPPPRAGESDSSNRYASSSSAPRRGGDRERDDGGRRAPNDRDRLNYDDTMDKRGDWERGGDLQRERYAAADRDRDHERYGGRDRDRDSRDDRDSRRWEGGDRRRRSRSRSRSPPRNDRDRPKERDRDDKRRRVE